MLCPVGCALVDMGEAMRQMADVKDSLDIGVKQNFIDPLQNLQDKDLKEITVQLFCVITGGERAVAVCLICLLLHII